MEKPKGKSTWSIIIKVIIAVATARHRRCAGYSKLYLIFNP